MRQPSSFQHITFSFAASLTMVLALALACDLTTDPLPEQGCISDAECPNGLHCLTDPGVCVQCVEDQDCPLSGLCDVAKHTCLPPEPECASDDECQIDGICAVGRCEGGKCTVGQAQDDTPCNDGDDCTLDDACVGGQCVGQLVPGCSPGPCQGLADGTACDDGDECTADDKCTNGRCEGLGVPGCGHKEDMDQDGYSEQEGDCNDLDPTINPDAIELCDEVDNNCNGTIDEACVVGPECFTTGCQSEICASFEIDSDCTWHPSMDCLVYTKCGPFGPSGTCSWEMNEEYVECLDNICVPSPEICDGLDNDCDGTVDEDCGKSCGGIAGLTCENQQFCKYPTNMCFAPDAVGVCTAVPQGCPDVYDPVCGCDGFTYGNTCEMLSSAVSKWHDGPCDEEQCQVVAGENFGPCLAILGYAFDGAYCVMVSGCDCGNFCPWIFPTKDKCEEACLSVVQDCENDADCPPGYQCETFCGNGWCSGTCVMEGNQEDWDGDGWTQENGDCDDYNASTYPQAQELCDALDNDCDGQVDEGCQQANCGGFMGLACPADEFCLFPAGTCGANDMMGVCSQLPGACPGIYSPVCGCDMQTYSNDCEATANGTSILHTGPCQDTGCFDLGNIDFGMCAMMIGWGFVGGDCVPLSGCGCGEYCKYIFSTKDECSAECLAP